MSSETRRSDIIDKAQQPSDSAGSTAEEYNRLSTKKGRKNGYEWKPNLIYKVTCCVRASVRDHWTQRKVTVDAEESDGKKKSGGRRREK